MKTLDLALLAICLMLMSCIFIVALQDITQSEREEYVCQSQGMVLIDSSSGRYCFEVPMSK